MPKELTEEAVTNYNRTSSVSPDEMPTEAHNLSTEQVEEQTVEQLTGISGQCGPAIMEDNKEGYVSSVSFIFLQVLGELVILNSKKAKYQDSVSLSEKPISTRGY
jgi:hypothetical protein